MFRVKENEMHLNRAFWRPVVALQITVSPNMITPALDRGIKNNIARKSGNKHVHGDVYKQRTAWKKSVTL